MDHQSPIINGDGSYSRDFTYIDNVVQMNLLAITTENEAALNQVYNTAVGDRTTLVQLIELLKKHLSTFDPAIGEVEITHGPNRKGDIPHSLASVEKAVKLLNYKPTHAIEKGIEEAVEWYWGNLK
jgi:UDP-N-acetylglucosamine 4-epimerase